VLSELRKASMGSIVIVTDSSACLPQELVEQYNIEVVPIEFTYEGRVYRDEIDTSPTEFYTLLARAKLLPTTPPSSPGSYLQVFNYEIVNFGK
jgi:fatty acid-binding protein DegV